MQEKENEDEYAYVYAVKNPSYNDISLCAWDSILYPGTPVIYETKYGQDLGIIVGEAPHSSSSYTPGCDEIRGACLHFGSEDDDYEENEDPNIHPCMSCFGCQRNKTPEKIKVTGKVSYIDHLATPSEMAKYHENEVKVADAIIVCREKIKKHKLNMKLISAHFLITEPKVIFFFISEERVDFRQLVKELVSIFKMRIELRQVGVRDESKLIGGLSVCGRDYCCHSINMNVDTVSIKMAKEQNLSLNSGKISGPCGRLLCCLSYEFDYYMEEKASCPPEGTKLKINDELWRVKEVNILSRKITVTTIDGRSLMVPFEVVYHDDELGFWIVDKEYQDELFAAE